MDIFWILDPDPHNNRCRSATLPQTIKSDPCFWLSVGEQKTRRQTLRYRSGQCPLKFCIWKCQLKADHTHFVRQSLKNIHFTAWRWRSGRRPGNGFRAVNVSCSPPPPGILIKLRGGGGGLKSILMVQECFLLLLLLTAGMALLERSQAGTVDKYGEAERNMLLNFSRCLV